MNAKDTDGIVSAGTGNCRTAPPKGTLGRRLLTGWVLAFALTGGYWGMALTPVNRWSMYFTHFDFRAVLAMTLAGGTILGLGAFAVERFLPRARPLLVASFWAWLALALANCFPEIHKTLASRMGWHWLDGPRWWTIVWSIGAIGMALALRLPSWRRGAARGWFVLRRILWPVVFVVPFSVWRLPSFEASYGNGLDFTRVPGNGQPATVVLMFDMLGYECVFDDQGAVHPALTNFAAFCERADVYHAADSAGTSTAESLPGFIVQKRLEEPPRTILYTHSNWYFSDRQSDTISPGDFAGQSLPVLARESGGRAQTIGMHIPWDVLLPGAWNATESMSIYTGHHGVHVFDREPSFWTAVKEHLAWYYLFVSKSPLSAVIKLTGLNNLTEGQCYNDRTSTVERAGRFFREALSPGDFFLVHVDLPHFPYVLGRDGQRLPYSLIFDHRKGMAAQTEGADWALGQWMEALAASPVGRDAWILVTSDHNLHSPRFRKGTKTHVPFLVHRPGQTVRHDIDAPADLSDLRHVLPDLPIYAGSPSGTGLQ